MASDYEKAGVLLELETSSWDAAWDSVTSSLNDLEDSYSVSIDAEPIGFDDVTSALDDIPDETNTEVNAEESENTKKAVSNINFLAALKKIEIAIDIAQKGFDIAMDIVNPLLDVQDAVAKVRAQTGQGFPGLEGLINDIKAADLGDSYDQIANVMVAAQNIGAPMEEATRAALTFTHTFKDQDPVTVMTTLNALATTFGLSMSAAADVMTVAFQQGLNKGGDLLSVVNSNSQSWKDMGLTSTQALSAMNSLMKGGVDSATDAAKGIQTLDDALTTAAANAKSPQADALRTLGITNPKDKGEAMGADFMDGFAEHFANLPADQQDLVSGALFGKVGKKFTGALTGLTTQGGPFADYVGAAEDAATQIDDSLRGSINDFINEIQTELVKLFSSDKIDLAGFLDKLKTGFQTAVEVLSGGGSIGTALEKGFGLQGFDTTVANLQRIFGNFEIIILQAVRAVQTLQGMDTSSIDEQIRTLAKGQIAFDLKVANPDEVGKMINQGLQRGLSTSDIADSMTTAINESFSQGNFTQVGNMFQGLRDAIITQGNDPKLADDFMAEFFPQWQAAYDKALAGGQFADATQIGKLLGLDPATIQTAVDTATTTISNAFAPKQRTGSVFDMTSVLGSPDTSFADTFAKKLSADDVTAATKTITDSANAMATSVGTASDQTVDYMYNAQASVQGLATVAQIADTDIANAMMGNTVTTTFETVAESAAANFGIVITWIKATEGAAYSLDQGLATLLGLLTQVKTAAGGIANITVPAAGGGGGNSTVNNVNVNNTVNTLSTGQAFAAGNSIAAGIRGMF